MSLFGGLFGYLGNTESDTDVARRVLQQNHIPIPEKLMTPIERHFAMCAQLVNEAARAHFQKYGTMEGFSFEVRTIK